ncbi:MAG: ATP-binding cassette domain-containing protein [Vicinamibacteraceae bacterium]
MTAPGDLDRLAFDAVTVDYGRSRVLSRVSFACRAGSVTGLFGPNGAGKTTLLRLAAARARASRGRVVYGGGLSSAAVRGRIGWLGHDPGLYPELTAAENLRFFAALHGVSDPEARVAEALDRARLRDRAGDQVGRFSRGMRQRIGLERALIGSPRIVLLDEPFTGLDEASSEALLVRLATLRESGAIVLLSTHDPARVAGLLDAAIVLHGGRVAAQVPGGPMVAAAIAAAHASSALPEAGPESTPETAPKTASEAAHAIPDATTGSSPTSRHDKPGLAATAAGFLRVAWLVAHKDALVELRSRELALTTLFFAVVAVLVFAFAFVSDSQAPIEAPAGILWVTTLFAGTLALARAFDREQAHQTLSALLSAPVDRAAIYAGKVLGLIVLLAIVLAIVIPLVGLLFSASFWRVPALFLGIVAGGVVGLVAVGGLFAAMLVRTRSRDVLLPVLLYPMVVPVLLAGVRGTAALLQPEPDRAVATVWLSILVSYDTVFVTLALWVFDAVTAED